MQESPASSPADVVSVDASHADEAVDPVVAIDAQVAQVDIAEVAAAGIDIAPVATAASEPAAAEQTRSYPTRIPNPFTFRYDMRRGGLGGQGEFSWKRTGNQYEARLQGTVGGIRILNWASTGGFDTAGVAPTRYTDQRIGKAAQAANFQRADSKITFSGPGSEYPLVAGAQDRLSWMVQLPAIVAADKSLTKVGARVGMFVVGARGDAETWVFQLVGAEPVKTPLGDVSATKWMREPRKPYDTKVEVWLDPARQYLPVRARLTSPPSDDPLELVLKDTGS